jgi:hypothetical protein
MGGGRLVARGVDRGLRTSTGMAKLTTGYDGYLVYPHYGTIRRSCSRWSTPRCGSRWNWPSRYRTGWSARCTWHGTIRTTPWATNRVAPPAGSGHGRRDNREGVALGEAGGPLPGIHPGVQHGGPVVDQRLDPEILFGRQEARYADNFIVAAHPNGTSSRSTSSGRTTRKKLVLMYQENTGCGRNCRTIPARRLPDLDPDHHALGRHRLRQRQHGHPTWHGIDRSDWEEYIENEAEYPGKIVAFNNNDDNENGIPDYLENADYEYPPGMSWVPFTDPDLVPVVLDRGFADLTGMDGFVFELKVTIGAERGLSYWLDQQKTPIIGSAYHPDDWDEFEEAGKMKRVYQWVVCGEAVNYPPLIYVEGVNPEALTDTLIWRLFDPDEKRSTWIR